MRTEKEIFLVFFSHSCFFSIFFVRSFPKIFFFFFNWNKTLRLSSWKPINQRSKLGPFLFPFLFNSLRDFLFLCLHSVFLSLFLFLVRYSVSFKLLSFFFLPFAFFLKISFSFFHLRKNKTLWLSIREPINQWFKYRSSLHNSQTWSF